MPSSVFVMNKRMQRSATGPVHTCVLYARVSSKEQEQEGYSIQAQLRLLREYAEQQNIQVLQEFVDVETAKTAGRLAFNGMLAYLKKQPSCHTLIVEKTDRLYRNLKDWVTIDEFELEIHFPKENIVIGPDSRSSEKFLHGIKVLMAKNYVENLGEEASKGMREKAKNGIWPSCAPTGYQNVQGADGRRTIIPHPVTAPVVRQIFEWFATGDYTLKGIATKLRAERLPFGSNQVNVSSIHAILRKRIYTGESDWKGTVFPGSYEPLITKATWERVQDLLNARHELRNRKMIHDFTYSGLLRCGHCGCAIVGELKKDRYIYYHCTKYKQKCPERYTREEVIHAEVTAILKRLVIPETVLKWLDQELESSTQHEARIRRQTIKSWQDEYARLQGRLDAMYDDKLDGRITPALYDRKAKDTRSRQEALRTKISEYQVMTADLRAGFNMMRLTSLACKEFQRQSSREQRKLLGLILATASWKDAHLDVTLHEPFRTLLLSNSANATKNGAKGASGPQIEDWLPKNAVLQLFLSNFFNVSWGAAVDSTLPAWFNGYNQTVPAVRRIGSGAKMFLWHFPCCLVFSSLPVRLVQKLRHVILVLNLSDSCSIFPTRAQPFRLQRCNGVGGMFSHEQINLFEFARLFRRLVLVFAAGARENVRQAVVSLMAGVLVDRFLRGP